MVCAITHQQCPNQMGLCRAVRIVRVARWMPHVYTMGLICCATHRCAKLCRLTERELKSHMIPYLHFNSNPCVTAVSWWCCYCYLRTTTAYLRRIAVRHLKICTHTPLYPEAIPTQRLFHYANTIQQGSPEQWRTLSKGTAREACDTQPATHRSSLSTQQRCCSVHIADCCCCCGQRHVVYIILRTNKEAQLISKEGHQPPCTPGVNVQQVWLHGHGGQLARQG